MTHWHQCARHLPFFGRVRLLSADHKDAFLSLRRHGFFKASIHACAFGTKQRWQTADLGKFVLFSIGDGAQGKPQIYASRWMLVEDIDWENGDPCEFAEAWSYKRRNYLASLGCSDLANVLVQSTNLPFSGSSTLAETAPHHAQIIIDSDLVDELHHRSQQIDALLAQSSYEAADALYYSCLRFTVPEEQYIKFTKEAVIDQLRRRYRDYDVAGAMRLCKEAGGRVDPNSMARLKREAAVTYKCTIRTYLKDLDLARASSLYSAVKDIIPEFDYHRRELRATLTHIAYQIENDNLDVARTLLNRVKTKNSPKFDAVVAYFRFLTADKLSLYGESHYQSLSPGDLFLAACYSEWNPEIARLLNNQTQWDYLSVMQSLSQEPGSSTQNIFKVWGLQPRIAELAFQQMYMRIHDSASIGALHDLNLETVQALATPWRLSPSLPPVDWVSAYGQEYDVKSNIYRRSKEKAEGLRGLFIKMDKMAPGSDTLFPGIIFFETTDGSCQWVYVGEYQPSAVNYTRADRVTPFAFRMPDRERFSRSISDSEFTAGLHVIPEGNLRFGWQMAAKRSAAKSIDSIVVDRFLATLIDGCQAQGDESFLEYDLWSSLNQAMFDVRSYHSEEEVEHCLSAAESRLSSGRIPVRLPKIRGKLLLSNWINSVLRPINNNWKHIRCEQCGTCASTPGAIKLTLERITAGGTILGTVACNPCGWTRRSATLITHCRTCSHHPLIIGRNQVCRICGGLKCDWETTSKEGPRVCGVCKCDPKQSYY
jgi:hypothetical protein